MECRCLETSCWRVSKSFQKVVTIAKKIENMLQPVIAFFLHSSAIKDVVHEMLSLVSLNEVRLPGAHAPNCSFSVCDGSFMKEALVDEKHAARLCW